MLQEQEDFEIPALSLVSCQDHMPHGPGIQERSFGEMRETHGFQEQDGASACTESYTRQSPEALTLQNGLEFSFLNYWETPLQGRITYRPCLPEVPSRDQFVG